MHLHDKNRPKISHSPAFIGGMIAIPQITIWPIEDPNDFTDGLIEISMMLPIKELDGFMAKWFHYKIHSEDLPDWLSRFRNDPERTVIETFSRGNFTPNLEAKQNIKVNHATKVPDLLLNDL
jgi:hypothetical protein